MTSHRTKVDFLRTSYNLICQRNKWEQTKKNPPPPHPHPPNFAAPSFIFHSLLLRGLWGLLLYATVGDQGRETAYILSSHLTKGFHILMRLLGKLSPSSLKTYLHQHDDVVFKLKGKGLSKLAASPNLRVRAGPQVCVCDTGGRDEKLKHKCFISVLSIFTDFHAGITSPKGSLLYSSNQ